jgi:hypothetical protein
MRSELLKILPTAARTATSDGNRHWTKQLPRLRYRVRGTDTHATEAVDEARYLGRGSHWLGPPPNRAVQRVGNLPKSGHGL